MKFRSIYYCLTLLVAFFCNSLFTYSQSNQVSFEYLTVDEGLSSPYVQCIYRDSKDYMWFGTNEQGLNKFNGYSVNQYKKDDNKPGSLSDNNVLCLFEDKAENVWIGTADGLNLYNAEADSFVVFRNDPDDTTSLSSNWIYDLVNDNNGNLWVATGAGGGLNKWMPENKNFISHRIPDNIGDDYANRNSITSVKVDSKGIFWIVNFGRGIYSFDPKTEEYKYYKDTAADFSGHSLKKMCIDDRDIIWIVSSEDGFYSFNPSTQEFRHIGKEIGLPGSDAMVITDVIQEDASNILIAADQGGVSRFNKKTGKFQDISSESMTTQGVNSRGIRSLFMDKEQILWVGTARGGVNYYNPKRNKFTLIQHRASDTHSKLRNIVGWLYEDSEGLIWIATDGGGLDVYNPKTRSIKNYSNDPANPYSISGNAIRCIEEDRDHNYWIATWDAGLNRFEPKSGRFYHYFPGEDSTSISSNAIWNFKIDHNDNIWLTPFFGGVDLFNKEKGVFKRFRSNADIPGSLSHNLVWFIYQDQEKNIWVCTHYGVNLYDTQSDSFKVYDNFPDNDIRSMVRDGEGKLWAGSVNGGLYSFDIEGHILKVYTEADGLANNTIYAIIEDNNGDLWITTNNGISKFNQTTKEFTNYYMKDGLQGNFFYELSAMKSRNGELYFGGYNGFNTIYPDSLKENDFIPKVYITEFRIFNQPVRIGSPESVLTKHISETKEITLSNSQTVFSFEFAAINYTNPEKNNYAYMMEGFENDWNYVGKKRDATYTNLDPGKYVFRVKASNNDGVWNEEGTALMITVKPAFWQTRIFRVGLFLFIVAAFVAFYHIRLAKIRKQRAVLSAQVRERTKELEDTNELLKKTNALLVERQRLTEDQARALKLRNKELQEQKKRLNKALDELQQAQMQLLQSEKMASLGILTAGVAHEINNPLNFIQTGLDAIETTVEDEKIQSETLMTILGHMNIGVHRASAIVKSLKAFSRKDSLSVRECDIHQIIDNSLLILDHELKHKCKVIKRYTTEKFRLIGNEENLHQVFINVIMNSVHALKEKGKIRISTEVVSDRLEIAIVDNGVGISKKQQKQIFDPFFTTKDPGKGVGLGLSIVYKIIADHKGEIKYSSIENKYTKVKITLPLGE